MDINRMKQLAGMEVTNTSILLMEGNYKRLIASVAIMCKEIAEKEHHGDINAVFSDIRHHLGVDDELVDSES